MISFAQPRNALSKEDREKYLEEMRQFKHEYLVRELDLSRDQQNQFFPIYDQMEDAVNKVADETRALENKVAADPNASDTEIESASRAMFEQKSKEGKIELEYYDKFKDVLSPRQLLKLKNSERKFTQELVRHRGKRARSGK